MLLIGWGGESVGHNTLDKAIRHVINWSVKKICYFSVAHHDLYPRQYLMEC